MGTNTTRLLPMGALGAAAAYCLWPFLDAKSTLPATASQAKIPRIEASLLSPSSQAPPPRNPFESMQPTGSGDLVDPVDPIISNVSETPREEEVALPQELVLSSTLVYGRRRHAIINGKIYSEGETLKDSPPNRNDPGSNADNPPLRLRRVEHDRVWIDICQGQKVTTLALEYSIRNESNTSGSQSNPDALVQEPGSAEQIAALAKSPQLEALRIISQNLFGRDLLGGIAQLPGMPVEQEFSTSTKASRTAGRVSSTP